MQNPTHSHTKASIAKQENELLGYLIANPKERFNVKAYSRGTGIARSTIYGMLYKLEKQDLITKETADAKITSKGKNALELLEGGIARGVGKPSLGVSESQNLSTHFHRFKLPITERSNFSMAKLNALNKKEVRIHNLSQDIAYFTNATIIINPHKVIIQISELISDEVDNSDIDSFNIMLEYAQKLRQAGLKTEGVIMEEGHWARMQSIFSDFLFEKIDDRYFLQLEDNSKFWIDHSKGKREDETNNKLWRARTDEAMKSLLTSKSTFNDVDKLIELSGNILEAQDNEFRLHESTNKNVAWLAENIKSHGPAWLGMAKEAGNIKKEIKRLSSILSQRRLKDYFG